MKKILKSLSCLIVIIALLPVTALGYNTGDDYPQKYKDKEKDAVVDAWNFYNRECTSFVAWCLNSRNGVGFTNQYKGASRWGHAKTWGIVAQKVGITVNKTPAVGAVAWWDTGTYGHVAWVKSVNGNNVVIEEYNQKGTGVYGQRTITASDVTGFIHIKDLENVTIPEKPSMTDVSVEGSKISASWKSVKGADKYVVDFWVSGGKHNYFDTADTNMTQTMPDGVYGVRVCAENSAGASGFTGFTYVTVPTVTTEKREQVVSDGLYTLKNVSSGYMLNVYGGKDSDGTKVTTWEYDGTTDQRIYIQHKGDGKYLLKFNASSKGRVIDVNRGESLTASIDDGDKIDLWTADDLTAQYFFINDCGNGAYSFELASKPDHVVAATSASAAKSNGTQLQLKKWNDSAYQKWYLCDTSGNIINSCKHSDVSKKVTNTAYQQKNDDIHTVVNKYNNVCDSCGETVKSNLTDEKTEKHSISNNKCTKCGYTVVIEKEEIAVEETVCKHSETYDGSVKETEAKQKDAENHTVIQKYDSFCSECKAVVEQDIEESYDERHQSVENKCSVCGYTVGVTECQHEKTEKIIAADKDNEYEQVDEETHIRITYYRVYCKNCDEKLKDNAFERVTEKHALSDGECNDCGFKVEQEEQKGYNDIYDEELLDVVQELSAFGIINGYSDGSFKPNNKITRAEFAKIICGVIVSEADIEIDDSFADVQTSHWAREYIYSAKNLGIINGTSKTTFAPDANITYEQAIKMIVAALGYSEEAEARGGYPNGYISIAKELGITETISFNKTALATRGNIAKMVRSAMNAPYYSLSNENGEIKRFESDYTLYERHNKK